MNKLMIWAASCLLPALSNAQKNYVIKGQIPETNKVKMVTMAYPPDDKGGEYQTDTAFIKNGKFEFKGTIGRPQLAELNLVVPRQAGEKNRQSSSDNEANNMKNVALFYLDGNIDIVFDQAGVATYKGGNTDQKAWEFYTRETTAKSKAAGKESDPIQLIGDVARSVIKIYPESYVGVDLLDIFTQATINPDLVGPMYEALSPSMQNAEKVLKWKPRLDKARALVSGNVDAPNFTINDINNQPVSLSSYKGSYVLVDFWASWCVPCRAENPNVIAAYEKFKKKGFQVLGVSLDTKKEAWLKAVKEDKLPWKQVCDFKAEKGQATTAYEISIIPANVLIDPNGKIIGKDLKGKALHDRLAELIK